MPEPSPSTEDIVIDAVRAALEDDDIAAEDNFFAVGGDSILALRVIAGAAEHGVSLDVVDVLTADSLAELAARAARASDGAARERPDPPAGEGPPLPEGVSAVRQASALQVGLVFLAEMAAPGTGAYLDFCGLRVAPVDLDALRVALHRLVLRHEALRSEIDLAGYAVPAQVIRADVPVQPEVVELGADEDVAELLAAWRRRVIDAGIDVAQAPPLRCHVAVHDGRMWVSLAIHHCLVDGWSFTRLLVDLLLHYDAALDGGIAELPEVPGDLAERFVRLEQEALCSPAARAFWAGQARRIDPHGAREDVPSATRRLVRSLPAPTWAGLERAAAAARVPVKSLCLGVHAGALGRVRGTAEVTTGLVTNGRPEVHGADQAVGLFLNTVPLVLPADGDDTARGRAALDAERAMAPWRRYPLAHMTSEPGGQLFEVTFNFTHFHSVRELDGLRRAGADSWWAEDVATFPLMVDVFAEDPALGTGVMVSFDPGLITEDEAARLLDELDSGLRWAAHQAPGTGHRASAASTPGTAR